jgi:hypothetical protein
VHHIFCAFIAIVYTTYMQWLSQPEKDFPHPTPTTLGGPRRAQVLLLPAADFVSFDLPDPLAAFSPFAPSPEDDDDDEEEEEDDDPEPPPSVEDDDSPFEEESFDDEDESFSEDDPSAAAAVSRWRLRVP